MPEPNRDESRTVTRLDLALAEYARRADGGDQIDREAFLDEYPDIVERLRACLAASDRAEQLAGGSGLPPEPLADARTLPPDDASRVVATETVVDGDEPTPRLSLGTKVRYFGDYELLEEIARGGMGVVYKARQVNLNRVVALKMILAGQLANEQDVQRFHAEAEAAAKLDHPGIVPIFEIGQHEGQHYFSMGFVEGDSLAKKVAAGPLPPRETAALGKAVAEAVEYAHQKGIIHRDLKPANVLLDQAGQPRVTDFGLAKQMQGDSGLTGTGQILGTPSYMPPEQAAGKVDEVGPAADVYALGAILYCLLTGRPPFQAASPMDTLLQVLEQEPVLPRQLNPQVPVDLETIALKCLEKEPSRRYRSAQHLVDELSRFLDGRPILARSATSWERGLKWARRRPAIAAMSAAIIFVVVAGLTGITWQWRAAVTARQAAEHQRQAALSAAEGEKQQAKKARLARDGEREQRVEAVRQQKIAEQERDVARRNLYLSHMHLARQAWESFDIARVQDLLERQVPATGQHDFRGWEWQYLHSQSRGIVTLQGHALPIACLDWSPEGRRLASAGALISSDAGELKVWDALSGMELIAPGGRAAHGVWTVAWSPDGKRLASGGGRSGGFQNTVPGELTIWDAATGQEALALRGHMGRVQAVAWSPDGLRLASVSGEFGPPGEVKIWDAQTGEELLNCPGHTNQVNSVSWSPDGERLATTSTDGTLRIWDAGTGAEVRTIQPSKIAVYKVLWSPDGGKILTTSADPAVKIWDAATGGELLTLAAPPAASLSWRPDSNHVSLVNVDGTVKIWNLATNMESEMIHSHIPSVHSATWSPDNARLALATSDQTIKIWDTTPVVESQDLSGELMPVLSVALTRDGKRMATTGSHIKIWDLATRQQVQSVPWPEGWSVLAAAWSPDGKRIVSSSLQRFSGTIKVWDTETQQELFLWNGHVGPVYALAWSPDGKLLATGGMDTKVKLWDASARDKEVRVIEDHTGSVLSVAWHPGGEWLASAGEDGVVRLWNSTDAKQTKKFPGHTGAVRSVIWSPDGRRLVSAGLDAIKVWDIESGKELVNFRGHSAPVLVVAWRPDADADRQRLASASEDGTVKLWDLSTGQEVLTLRGNKRPLVSLAWTPDGRLLIAGDAAGTIKIWDAGGQSSATELRALQAQQRAWEIVKSRNKAGREYRNALLTLENQDPAAAANPEYLMKLGVARFRVGDFQEAVETLTKADELARTGPAGAMRPVCLAVLAMSHLKLGHDQQAIATLREVNELTRSPQWEIDATLMELLIETAWTATNGASRWTSLVPSATRSEGGATLVTMADGSILVSGENPPNDTYTIECLDVPRITALRLEVLRDDSLPGGGPGRLANGTFILSGVEATIQSGANEKQATPLRFLGAIAEFVQSGHDANSVVDGRGNPGWAISNPGVPLSNSALILLLAESVTPAKDAKLIIRLRHQSAWKDGNLGNFRLSVTGTDPWWSK